jgi:hypothetical protein
MLLCSQWIPLDSERLAKLYTFTPAGRDPKLPTFQVDDERYTCVCACCKIQ